MNQETFGQALRRRRHDADLSQSTLARRAYIHQGNLSRYESDQQQPSKRTAEALDAALDAGGELAALAHPPGVDVLNADQHDRLAALLDRPQLDAGAVESLAAVLAAQRRLDDTVGPAPLLSSALAQRNMVLGVLKQASGTGREALAEVAAESTQFVGWLNASCGRYSEALRWLADAEQAADEIGSGVLAAQAANFRGYVARHQQNWRATVRWFLAEHYTPGASVHQRIGAAAQAAHGLGNLGRHDDARRLLDVAAGMLPEATQHPAPRTAYWLSADFHRLNIGLACTAIGANDVAADHLRAGLEALPPEQQGGVWTIEYREALTLAEARR